MLVSPRAQRTSRLAIVWPIAWPIIWPIAWLITGVSAVAFAQCRNGDCPLVIEPLISIAKPLRGALIELDLGLRACAIGRDVGLCDY